MSNDKQLTSIDWLEREIQKSLIPAQKDYFKWAFEQAKTMHKEEIEKAHARGEVTGFGRVNHPQFYADKTPENYYNETFGGEE